MNSIDRKVFLCVETQLYIKTFSQVCNFLLFMISHSRLYFSSFYQQVIRTCRCLTDLCEDEELKERITEIQREIEHSRLAKSRELSRRRSANIRRCPCHVAC